MREACNSAGSASRYWSLPHPADLNHLLESPATGRYHLRGLVLLLPAWSEVGHAVTPRMSGEKCCCRNLLIFKINPIYVALSVFSIHFKCLKMRN